MGKYGPELSQLISNIVDHEQEIAKNQRDVSKSTYKSSTLLFSIIFLTAVSILTILSLLLTILIRSSIKEFTRKLNVLSKGDFTVEFDTKLTNEFGTMNKALYATIIAIGEILKTVKSETVIVREQAVGLENISDQVTDVNKEVVYAIQGVAESSASQVDELMNMNHIFNSFGENLEGIGELTNNVDMNAKEINVKANSSNDDLKHIITSIDSISVILKDIGDKTQALTDRVAKVTEITDLINDIQ
ncbi:MAG: hypothetical protein ACERKZ_19970 [Lachnotalea sp.]